jgi:hypothetical protein
MEFDECRRLTAEYERLRIEALALNDELRQTPKTRLDYHLRARESKKASSRSSHALNVLNQHEKEQRHGLRFSN